MTHSGSLILGIFAIFLAVAPAGAFDCGKAATNVEKAICSDDRLKWADQYLNERFNALHEALFDAEASALLSEERQWLKQRDEACGKATSAEITDCLLKMIRERNLELGSKSSGVHIKGDGELPAKTALTLFDKKLPVEQFPAQSVFGSKPRIALRIVYNDVELVEASDRIAIEGRFKNRQLEAALLALDRGGTLDCAVYVVIIARKDAPLRVDRIAGGELLCGYNVDQTATGFSFVEWPAPDSPARNYAWDAQRGESRDIKSFQPKAGSKLESVAIDAEPTDNEEFFQLIQSQTGHDWKAFANTLQYSTVQDAGLPARYRVLAKCETSLRSGCDFDQRGRYYSDWETEPFAIIDLQERKAYFAIYFLKGFLTQGSTPDAQFVAYPPESNWPEEIRAALNSWKAVEQESVEAAHRRAERKKQRREKARPTTPQQ